MSTVSSITNSSFLVPDVQEDLLQTAPQIQQNFAPRVTAAAAVSFGFGLVFKLIRDLSRDKPTGKKWLSYSEYGFITLSIILGLVSLVGVTQAMNEIEYGTKLSGSSSQILVQIGKPAQILQATAFTLSTVFLLLLVVLDNNKRDNVFHHLPGHTTYRASHQAI
jgi:hypothetical protein